MTPKQWRDLTIGKSYDVDQAYGNQCWDYFAYFVQHFKLPISTKCSLTNYVCDLWRLRDKNNYSAYFDYITDASKLKDGDWVIWDRGSSHPYSHIAMYYKGKELGQNQGATYVNEKAATWDILGAFRFKNWGEIATGPSDITINGHKYALYRQGNGQIAVVLAAGINKVASIHKLDADVRVYAKITGANYFQMRTDQDDPVNTTYGDLSAPLNDVWTEVPNQDSTLYYDLETGSYGDCTGIHVDPVHNVFSPAVVYPPQGNYQYARMVGIGHVNTVSRYTFLIRFKDGTYAVGLAMQDMTPKQIAEDIRTAASDLDSISFLDGGGSAQMGRWNNSQFEYVRDTGRECPSAVAIIDPRPLTEIEPEEPLAPQQEPESGTDSSETEKDEEESMNNETTQEQAEIVAKDDWTDPEPQTNVIADRIASLLSVKSILTLVLTGVFAYLVINEIAIPEFFTDIYKIVILFFFGYQTGKASNGKG